MDHKKPQVACLRLYPTRVGYPSSVGRTPKCPRLVDCVSSWLWVRKVVILASSGLKTYGVNNQLATLILFALIVTYLIAL